MGTRGQVIGGLTWDESNQLSISGSRSMGNGSQLTGDARDRRWARPLLRASATSAAACCLAKASALRSSASLSMWRRALRARV